LERVKGKTENDLRLGLAMINCILFGFGKKVLEGKDIAELAGKRFN